MKIIREADGKGVKVLPASQARKDPEGRKVQRAYWLKQGYTGLRFETEEGVEVFSEATVVPQDVARLTDVVASAIKNMTAEGADWIEVGSALGVALRKAVDVGLARVEFTPGQRIAARFEIKKALG